MATENRQFEHVTKAGRDAIVDRLRANKTQEEILAFDTLFNEVGDSVPLYDVICELLRNRSISRGLAAKWLKTLMDDRERKLNQDKPVKATPSC